jgi:hypothetical protein
MNSPPLSESSPTIEYGRRSVTSSIAVTTREWAPDGDVLGPAEVDIGRGQGAGVLHLIHPADVPPSTTAAWPRGGSRTSPRGRP